MMPISQIKVGDVFENPLHRPWGCLFVVEEVDVKEKMVKVQSYAPLGVDRIGAPFWKKNTDRMFSEMWMVHTEGTQ